MFGCGVEIFKRLLHVLKYALRMNYATKDKMFKTIHNSLNSSVDVQNQFIHEN